MADGVLFVRGQLGIAAVLGVGALVPLAHAAVCGDEQRVVPETVVPVQPLEGDAARTLAHAGQVSAVRQDEAHRRNKLCPALFLRDLLHGVQQLVVVGLVIAVVAAVTGTVDAGCTAQCVHTQAGIIGDGGQTAGLADRFSLDEGILCKGGARLVRLDGDAQFLLAHHLVALRFQDAAQFAELSGIAGGCTNFHWFLLFSKLPVRGEFRPRAAGCGRDGERVSASTHAAAALPQSPPG